MHKTLGNKFLVSKNFFLSLLFTTQALLGASIVLRITDVTSRMPLKVVAIGEPFILDIRLQGFDEAKKVPLIPGLEKVRVQQTQEQLSIVNGAITNQYQYVCRIDTPGSYTVGPVTVEHNGTPVSSNTLNFIAQEQAEPVPTQRSATSSANSSSNKQRHKKEQPVICRLTLGHDHAVSHAVVGQKIRCTLRLYYSPMVTAIAGMRHPDLPEFVLGDFERKDEGQELIDGVEYRYIDFVGDICAQEPGKKMIPAFSVDYDVQLPSRGSFFDFFNHAKRERVYSNTAHLTVEALPSTDKKVHAIGEFKALGVGLDTLQAKEGAGITLTVEVFGHGNFNIAGGQPPAAGADNSNSAGSGASSVQGNGQGVNEAGLAPFELQGLSESLKQYASKQYTVPAATSEQAEKTCFEFIVQGLRAGKYEIPAQEFTYFDVAKKKYVTLYSKPVLFTVTPGAGALDTSDMQSRQEAGSNQENSTGHENNGSGSESENASLDNSQNAQAGSLIPNQMPLSKATWYPVKQRGPLSWWLFMLLLLMPLVGLASVIMRRRLEKYQDRYLRFTNAKSAFEQARSELAQSKRDGDLKSLHALFMRLIARRCRISELAVSQEFIKKELEQRNYPAQEKAEWDLFMAELEACKYGQNIREENNAMLLEKRELFAKAERWISWLEKRL